MITVLMSMTEWVDLCRDGSIIDVDCRISDVRLAFQRSLMAVADQSKKNVTSMLTFIDFLEAMTRVTMMKSFPTPDDLEEAFADDVLDFFKFRAKDPENYKPTPTGGRGGLTIDQAFESMLVVVRDGLKQKQSSGGRAKNQVFEEEMRMLARRGSSGATRR
jgi:hypothetical protein